MIGHHRSNADEMRSHEQGGWVSHKLNAVKDDIKSSGSSTKVLTGLISPHFLICIFYFLFTFS